MDVSSHRRYVKKSLAGLRLLGEREISGSWSDFHDKGLFREGAATQNIFFFYNRKYGFFYRQQYFSNIILYLKINHNLTIKYFFIDKLKHTYIACKQILFLSSL